MEILRSLTDELLAHLNEPEITLLIGPRQAGKATLLKHLAKVLRAEGKQTRFFNIDILEDQQLFRDQTYFVNHLLTVTGGVKHYVFIDEVQRLPD